MPFDLKPFAIVALFSAVTVYSQGYSGSGQTTRYWDCCKPSCAWPNSGVTSPVATCDINDHPLNDVNAQSGCEYGGSAYMCSDQTPWAISDSLAYGFAAVGGSNPKCCACYQLTFTSSSIAGKQMIVQATNTGTDVSSTQFDLAMPGGGFGLFDACTTEWGATSDVWGAQYGGPDHDTCSQFPWQLQSGCEFRWDWMQGASNPDVDYQEVECPAELVAKSGCSVAGSVQDQAQAVHPLASAQPVTTPIVSKVTTTETPISAIPTGTLTTTTTEEAGIVEVSPTASVVYQNPHAPPVDYYSLDGVDKNSIPVVDQHAAMTERDQDDCDV